MTDTDQERIIHILHDMLREKHLPLHRLLIRKQPASLSIKFLNLWNKSE